MKQQEVWKPVIGYEGYYEASNLGKIRSVDRYTLKRDRWGGESYQKIKGKILKPGMCGSGYLKVSLCVDGKAKNHMVHRLVALAFIENPDKKREVNHKNFDKLDNNTANLEWVTPSENHVHAVLGGVHVSGYNDKRSKTVIQKDLEGKFVSKFGSTREASRMTGISQACISDCCLGKISATKGFKFEFAA